MALNRPCLWLFSQAKYAAEYKATGKWKPPEQCSELIVSKSTDTCPLIYHNGSQWSRFCLVGIKVPCLKLYSLHIVIVLWVVKLIHAYYLPLAAPIQYNDFVFPVTSL